MATRCIDRRRTRSVIGLDGYESWNARRNRSSIDDRFDLCGLRENRGGAFQRHRAVFKHNHRVLGFIDRQLDFGSFLTNARMRELNGFSRFLDFDFCGAFRWSRDRVIKSFCDFSENDLDLSFINLDFEGFRRENIRNENHHESRQQFGNVFSFHRVILC